MIPNSGFLNDENEFSQISASFSKVKILGRSAANIYGSATRFGKRWFFKGIRTDISVIAAATARQRLLKEFDIQIGLTHPGVARIISFEQIDGIGQCIIAEWIEGDTLADFITQTPLTPTDSLRIFSEIVNAISYIHSQGIVHRDIKPTNIMIRKNGHSAVVIDFSLADTDAHLYQKSPAGTEGYASPRQYSAFTPFTGDDIHALGVILQQLCPRLSTIARRCIAGKYPTADILRTAIKRRYRIRRLIPWLSTIALFFIVITSLLIYISSLQNKTATLQDDITSMADSLTTVTHQLDNEKNVRLNHERRQSQINDLKLQLNQRLDKVFTNFRKTEDPTNPDNLSLVRLVNLLEQTKTYFLNNEAPISLSDSEAAELEFTYLSHYNTILQQWNQTLNQYRTNN